eukprot:scaffold93815_cov60-Cyclotella_meneghiniana.AAC.1
MRSPLERAPPSGPPGGPKNSTLSGRRSRPETPSSAPAGKINVNTRDELVPTEFSTLSILIHEATSKTEMTSICSSGL